MEGKGGNKRKCYRPKGRTLHLIDLENLVGRSQGSERMVAETLATYRCTIAPRAGDHVVIASGRGLMMAAGTAWPGARLCLGRGIDGADLALLDVARPVTSVATAYDRVVIGSGDGIFAPLAAELRRAGVVVCVVSRRESLSSDLRGAAALVRPLGPPAIAGVELDESSVNAGKRR